MEKNLGPGHPYLAASLNYRAEVLSKQVRAGENVQKLGSANVGAQFVLVDHSLEIPTLLFRASILRSSLSMRGHSPSETRPWVQSIRMWPSRSTTERRCRKLG